MASTNTSLALMLKQSFLIAERDCSVPTILSYSKPLPGVHITFHDLITILCAVSCILSSMICLFIICGHLFHWVKPQEQRQIVRIIAFLPITAIVCFFSVWFPNATGYVTPISQYYEGFSIVAIFYLYNVYITPDESTRQQFFHRLERRRMFGKGSQKQDKGSLRWFRITWIMVFQIIIGRACTFVADEVLQATSCPLSMTRKYGAIVIQIVAAVNTIIAVVAVIQFERRMKDRLQQHRALFKLFAFKTIIALQLFQDLIFTVVGEDRIFSPTEYVSYTDFTAGLPSFILCWEMFAYSIMFITAYEYRPYRLEVQNGASAEKTVSAALLDVINPMDIIRGLLMMLTHFRYSPEAEGHSVLNTKADSDDYHDTHLDNTSPSV